MKSANRLLGVIVLFLFAAADLQADTRHLHLPIGDPDRKGQEIALTLDTIIDTHTGESLTPLNLPERLADHRLIFVGENHTNMDFHNVQLRVIEELHRAGRQVLLGLEMYPYTDQEILDGWIAGLYTEEGFIEISHWYDRWGYHWNYYRRIFLFARKYGIPMVAINAPREVISSVRKKGFENLTEEEVEHIPRQIDTESDEHRQLFKAFFDPNDPLHGSLTEEQWDGMFRAQCTWDATMGYNAVRALEDYQDPNAVMVVLIGSGHVAYGLGIERQSAQWFDGKTASLIPIPVRDDEGQPVHTVRASYADFIWGLPPQADPLYPTLGLSTTKVEGEDHRKVIRVADDSPAQKAGFEITDVLLEMDGTDLVGKEPLNRLMATKRWGDEASFTVRRGREVENLVVYFRRVAVEE
jgi:uncharacterized iron-regulated protein